jgi:hypothetical protein
MFLESAFVIFQNLQKKNIFRTAGIVVVMASCSSTEYVTPRGARQFVARGTATSVDSFAPWLLFSTRSVRSCVHGRGTRLCEASYQPPSQQLRIYSVASTGRVSNTDVRPRRRRVCLVCEAVSR